MKHFQVIQDTAKTCPLSTGHQIAGIKKSNFYVLKGECMGPLKNYTILLGGGGSPKDYIRLEGGAGDTSKDYI